MEILSNESCNINDYCGHIILSYLYVDKNKADKIASWLDEKGYDYIRNEISPVELLKGSYCQKFNELLSNCGCYIFPLTKNFNEKHRPLINVLLYQIGVLEANSVDRVIPVTMYPKGFVVKDDDTLAGIKKGEERIKGKTYYIKIDSLLLTTQKAHDKKSLFNSFEKIYHNFVSLKDFYNAKENQYLKERLVYRKIHVSLDITNADFNAAIEKANKSKRTSIKTEEKMLHWLNTSLASGTDVISFGTASTLTNNTRPYENESKISRPFCLKMKNGRSFYIKNDKNDETNDNDIKGRILIEFIVPVHKLLGVNFKCFIHCRGSNNKQKILKSDATILELLFRSNFKKENDNDVHKYLDRLYFRFNFKDTKNFVIPAKFGKKADYIYPQ